MTRWRCLALVAALVAAAIAIGCGLRSGTPDRPSGDKTVLRVEPFSSRVSCGSRDVSVSIYLDDLEQRPSALDASVAAGLTAFEFPLRYDPKVLQIGPADNIEPNAALSDEDGDKDGVARTFIPVSNINDGEGWAVLGAASYNPASDGSDAANTEEGLDPVARGGPILLATVHFQSVGEGTSSVTIEPVTTIPGRPAQGIDLFDVSSIESVYKNVTVKGTSITVSGGDCSGVAISTPLPTPLPSSTPYVEPTRHIPTPQYLTPTPAAQGGRPDCPSAWAVYRDPEDYFSVCYPVQWIATESSPQADLGTVFSVRSAPTSPGLPEGAAALTIYWEARSAYYEGVAADRCHAVSHWRDLQEVTLTLSGRMAIACVGYETLVDPALPPLRSTFVEVPLKTAGGFVVVFLTEPEGDEYQADRAVLSRLMGALILSQ